LSVPTPAKALAILSFEDDKVLQAILDLLTSEADTTHTPKSLAATLGLTVEDINLIIDTDEFKEALQARVKQILALNTPAMLLNAGAKKKHIAWIQYLQTLTSTEQTASTITISILPPGLDDDND
jgi:hypothetical protein